MKKRNYFKKSLAILLSLMMIMGTMVMIPLTTSADDSVPEEAASKWIEVGTAEELAALKDAINAYEGDLAFIRLTADIEVGAHTPINGTNKPVYFDGQNYKLINMTIGSAEERAGNTGLFQSVLPGSTLMNIHFVGAKVYGGKSQQSGILLNDQKNGVTVVNVSTDETSLIDHSSNRVGGLIGRIYGGNSTDTTYIAYCVNAATVNSAQDAGGILGGIYGCYNITFDHCVNKGNITSTTNAANQKGVGGIMGRGERGSGANHITDTTIAFRDCYNVGTLSMKVSPVHQGGISGMIQGYHNANGPFGKTTFEYTRCYDYSAREYAPIAEGKASYNRAIASWGDTCQATKYFTDCYGANKVDSASPYPTDSIQLYSPCTHEHKDEAGFLHVAATNGVVVPADGDTNPLDDKITLSTGDTTLEAEMKRIDDAIAAGVTIGSNEYLPLIISNMDDWKAFCAMEPLESAKNEDAPKALYVDLKCDLDLSAEAHTPIQVCKYSTLVFNGNNHVIKGLNVGTAEAGAANAALFYRLGFDSVISNLHFVGAKIYGTGQMTAVVANEAYAGIKMYNVSVDATSAVVGGGNHTGGLVGRIYTGDATKHYSEFVNCANAAAVTGPVNVGGIIGNINGNHSVSFKNCINTGALTTTATSSNIGVGGFLAMHDRGTTNPTHTVSFENCVNTGAMSLVAETSAASAWVGGMFGCLRGNNPEGGSTLIVKNCFDYSKKDFVKAAGQYTGVGALGGNADNAQLNKYLNGNAAVNVAGSATVCDKVWAFTISNTVIENNYNTVAESLTAEITLGMDGETAITSTVKAEMEAINNGVYATLAGLKGTGTETDPIVIDSAKAAANFSKFSANFMCDMLYVHMTASLDFANVDFAPIKLNVPVNFNGADTSGTIKSIKNLALDGLFIGGFFEILPAGSVVKNVNFKNISITNTRFAGILAGATYANITVENVYVEDTCYVQGEGHVGGIIGGTYNEQTSVGAYTFKNIVSAAKIQATGTSNAGVGGIIGFISRGATTLDFENCVRMNEMRYELEGSFHNNRVMGGMIGKTTYDAANNVEANFTNCVNLSDMVANGSIGHIGGLVGWLHFDKVVNVDHCFVAGTYAVTGSSSTYFKGLIANHADAELTANVTDSYALLQTVNGDVNAKYDNENLMKPKTEAPGIKTFVNSGLVADVNAKITLTGEAGATPESTIAAEVAAILELAHPVHYYAGNCDEHCDMCMAARTVDHMTNPHKYTGGADGCDEWCDTCGEGFREIDERAHLYANKCATECKTCGHTRDVVPHANAKACATACPDCKEALVPTAEHAYDNTCDTDCNNCSETRTIEHTSAGACDEKCDVCDAPLTPSGAHVWANDQDTECDVCGATRTVTPPADDPAGDEPAGDEPAGDKPADDEDETTAAPADDETTAKDTVKADTTEPAAEEGCASSVAGIGALLALTASFGFALVGKKKED